MNHVWGLTAERKKGSNLFFHFLCTEKYHPWITEKESVYCIVPSSEENHFRKLPESIFHVAFFVCHHRPTSIFLLIFYIFVLFVCECLCFFGDNIRAAAKNWRTVAICWVNFEEKLRKMESSNIRVTWHSSTWNCSEVSFFAVFVSLSFSIFTRGNLWFISWDRIDANNCNFSPP